MNNSSWTVREATPNDLDLIGELYLAVRRAPRPPGYGRWRYLASPLGPAPGVLALEGGRAVGFFTLSPTPLHCAGMGIKGAQSMDTMTHPDFRGRGLFVTLARACYEIAQARGIRLLYGFPNKESHPGFVRRLEWTHVGDIAHWIRPVRPSRHPGLPGALGIIADGLAALWPIGERGNFEIRVGPPDPARLAALNGKSATNEFYRVERTPAWLGWRYAPEAAQGYEEIVAARNGAPLAAAVWGMQDLSWQGAGDGRAHLVELAGADSAARSAALAEVIARAGARGAWLLESVTNEPAAISTLRRAGFLSHRGAPLIVRTLGPTADPDTPDARESRNWRIIGGDLDTF